MIAAMVVSVVIGAGTVGGAMFYMLKTGKIGGGSAAITKVEAHEAVAPKTHAIALEPILVNLADPGGRAYLRLGLTLRVMDDEPVKGEKPKEEKVEKGVPKGPSEAETAVRDTVLTVLGQQTADGLLEPEGKEALKDKLRVALAAHNPTLKVTDLFFSEFLVQR
ncbi:flagellar basal body-associated FliL family protein [Granulicella sibirica]|uniref:flagellar basal body-associated FliL family protein n=1 Tax=Granulicella sibirica TaxID=2479048 RepID=UPI00137565F7|nr:flagellar basal body-associated FliL family protein [Granulicella sibirica]